jgi:hypothetical protein
MYLLLSVIACIIFSFLTFLILIRYYSSGIEIGMYVRKQIPDGCCHHCCECGMMDECDVPDFNIPKCCPNCEEMVACEDDDMSNFSCPVCETRLVAVSNPGEMPEYHWERFFDVVDKINEDREIDGESWKNR